MDIIEIRAEAIIFSVDKKLLLAKHIKNSNSYWVLPGGHLKYGEGLESCIRREIYEELNIKNFNVEELIFVDEFIEPNLRHVIKIGFHIIIADDEFQNIRVSENNEAIREVKFFSKEEIIDTNEIFYPSKEFFLSLMEMMRNA